MDKIIEKWDEILNTVKQEYEISDVSFDTWIRPLEVFAIEGNTLYILCLLYTSPSPRDTR